VVRRKEPFTGLLLWSMDPIGMDPGDLKNLREVLLVPFKIPGSDLKHFVQMVLMAMAGPKHRRDLEKNLRKALLSIGSLLTCI
jgi:hypothetical protein